MSERSVETLTLTYLEAFMLYNALEECAPAFASDPKMTEEHRAAIRSALLKLEDTFGDLGPVALAY